MRFLFHLYLPKQVPRSLLRVPTVSLVINSDVCGSLMGDFVCFEKGEWKGWKVFVPALGNDKLERSIVLSLEVSWIEVQGATTSSRFTFHALRMRLL